MSLAEDGKEVSFSWPDPLPVPVLDANTATYLEVLPGVDLRASATPTGYSYVLVVKNAEAAANPELAELTLDAETAGLSLRKNEGGPRWCGLALRRQRAGQVEEQDLEPVPRVRAGPHRGRGRLYRPAPQRDHLPARHGRRPGEHSRRQDQRHGHRQRRHRGS
ncbi:hypothetical protein [Actinoplanes derwentensis]|uniref:hypothetical protein n=1 Tax=Actinoplanes derwentensis TaxID=113562 RepID=UPI0012FD88D0|nr:hypothetical protein [Actinoplanes derwentensis]GID86331.1 hypothetical protein Ade03nite_52550 [Actinoplanes derwentensis]